MVLARDPLCTECLKTNRIVPSTTADHLVAKHLGGDDSLENLRGLCTRCHKIKSAREGQASR
jgi:5-methylcytosine-specific restriction enzyme A